MTSTVTRGPYLCTCPHRLGENMKLLLTSGGVTNPTIQSSLVELLGKPVAECSALHPDGTVGPPELRTGFGARLHRRCPPQLLSDLGWASVGVLELTALPSIGEERWVPGSTMLTSCWSTAEMPPTCLIGCASQVGTSSFDARDRLGRVAPAAW